MKPFVKLLALVTVLSVALCALAGAEQTRAAEYLNAYYNVPEWEGEPTLESVNAALEALGAEPMAELSRDAFAQAVVRLAGMEALALTYTNADAWRTAEAALNADDVTVGDPALAPYVACALDLDLIDDDDDDALDAEQVQEAIYRACEIAGRGRHYIGRVSDDEILQQLGSALSSFVIFDEAELTNLGTEIVLRGAATGYNLKYAGYDANFLPQYTLKYGHSDPVHALQLVALLEREGFDAYVQVEPKVSVYEYMLDWGDPGDPTPTYAVRQVTEDRYLCYAVEYDLMLEFDSIEEKETFHSLIETYAKKYDDSYDADGNLVEPLLDGAWWQPLYSSTTVMENEEFGHMVDNIVYDREGRYSIHPFSLPEKTAEIEAVVAEVAPELSVSPLDIYVNPAFMRYTTGEDYQ